MSNENLAREVVSGFGFRWVYAEVAQVFQHDIQHVRLNIRGQRANGVLANAQWVLHQGDRVIALGPNPETREWLILGYADSVNPGNWFGDNPEVMPDPTSGQGPIPGFRVPMDSDTLWYEAYRTGDESEASRSLIPRPRGGDQPPSHNDHYVRVIAGQPDPAETEMGLPGDGLPPSLAPFSAIGKRIQIAKPLDPVTPPGAYCITSAQAAQGGDTLTYQAGTLLNVRPLGQDGAVWAIGSGYCGPQSDYTTLQFGTQQMQSHAGGIELRLYYNVPPDGNHRLYYLKFAPHLGDLFLCVGVFNGQAAVGIGREILNGMPYPYPSGGVLSVGGNETPSGMTWFDITPYPDRVAKNILDRDGLQVGFKVYTFSEIYVRYRIETTVVDGVPEERTLITVSDGLDGETFAKKYKTYWVSGALFGGNVPQNLYGFGGDAAEGQMISGERGWTINGRRYPFSDPRQPHGLRGYRGELGWHARVWPGDPIPGGNGTYADDIGDRLPDCLVQWISDTHVLIVRGKVIRVDDAGLIHGAHVDSVGAYPQHDEAPDAATATHPLHPTLETLRAFLQEAEITTDDIAATDENAYFSEDDRETLDAAASGLTAEPAWIDLTAQVTGSTRSFTTPDPYEPGTLRMRINSLELQNGREFTETGASSFEINLRTPSATAPKDVIRAAYREA